MNKPINAAQLKCLNTMISKMGLKDQKAEMVMTFSSGRASSSKDLYSDEATDLIQHLKRSDPDEKKAEVMRRKIISRFHEMGYKKDTGAIDMKRVDGWCKKYGQFHKSLNNHPLNELPALVTQVDHVYQSYLASI